MKTVAQKLFLKPGRAVQIINAPDNVAELLGAHEANVLPEKSRQPVDVILLFARNHAELEARLDQARQRLAPDGALQVAYPKGTSKAKSDINRDSIREYAQTLGLEAVAIIAIDDTWSCLRLKIVS
jgi:Protein of unknown function (DUF3052)